MSTGDDANRLAAEARACVLIDRQLTDAGWSVRGHQVAQPVRGPGRRAPRGNDGDGHGRADYLLYVDQKVVG